MCGCMSTYRASPARTGLRRLVLDGGGRCLAIFDRMPRLARARRRGRLAHAQDGGPSTESRVLPPAWPSLGRIPREAMRTNRPAWAFPETGVGCHWLNGCF